MNQALYTLIGYLTLPLMVLRLLVKSIKNPDYFQRIGERFGSFNKIPVPIIWIHCVSVGEFRASIVLIDKLIKAYPDYRIFISTTTPTGSQAVVNHYGNKVLHKYFPFDLPLIVRRYVKRLDPKICLLLETEIWPNLIKALHKKKIPTLLINARLSQKSLEKYQKFAPNLAKQTINKLSLVAAQNNNSADRFIALGANADKVENPGNIKFEQKFNINQDTKNTFNKIINKRKCVVFASTHNGEERQILDAFLKVKDEINALVIIVPRHMERFNEVYKLIEDRKFKTIKRSENISSAGAEIMLGDSMGEMMNYFDAADVVFMGGSLVDTGGHNMLEPAALSKPILFGPNVFNFTEISQDLLAISAAIQISDADELFVEITKLINNQEIAQNIGSSAKNYFDSKQGAVEKLEKIIASYLN